MVMKSTKLFAVLLSLAFLGACAGTKTQSTSAPQAAPRTVGDVIDDTSITTKLKAALLADPDISSFKIGVTTKDGRVTLKGEIKTLALRNKVEGLAKKTAGVKSVDNQLVITG
jgi:hyperosmotically inducible protein